MDEEIVIDRGNTSVMKLDADEQAIMDEIEISAPRPQRVPRPTRPKFAPPQMGQQQESMDAFVNPTKQTVQNHTTPDEEIDYGDGDEDANFSMMVRIMVKLAQDKKMINQQKGMLQSMKKRRTLLINSDAWRKGICRK